MTLNLHLPETEERLSPHITVIGVGGAGGNAVNNMIQSSLEGVDFLVANTDAQSLKGSHCESRIQLGREITRGLGAGSRPDLGKAAAEESLEDILQKLEGVNMAFITAGMGGGTGTGAAPVIAKAAREQGILTVGVVTKPFQFEGMNRMRLAEQGIEELTKHVDTLIIIPNQNLFRLANEKTTFADAFKMADDVLYSGVRGVTDLMVMPGLINLDFADIRTIMSEMGKAMMGTGEAEGDNRAISAAEAAISNPLLDDVSMRGAKGVLINITGGSDMTLFEVDEAANRIRDEVDPEANIIFGSTFDESLAGSMRVSVVATGIDADTGLNKVPSDSNYGANFGTSSGTMNHRIAQSQANEIAVAGVQSHETEQNLTQEGHMSDPVDESITSHLSPEDQTSIISTQESQKPHILLSELVDQPSDVDIMIAESEMMPIGDGKSGEDLPLEEVVNLTADDQSSPVQQDQTTPASVHEFVPTPSYTQVTYSQPPYGQESYGQESYSQNSDSHNSYDKAAFAETVDQDSASPEPGTSQSVSPSAGHHTTAQTSRQATGRHPVEATRPSANKAYSLFARVAHAAKSMGYDEVGEENQTTAKPKANGNSTDTSQKGASQKDTLQPSLYGLHAEERVKASKETDDMLEIPAFLRRQAN